jgi:hypothetical protein
VEKLHNDELHSLYSSLNIVNGKVKVKLSCASFFLT